MKLKSKKISTTTMVTGLNNLSIKLPILPVNRLKVLTTDENKNNNLLLLPLSFAQKRLWFLDQFDPGSNTYNITFMININYIIKQHINIFNNIEFIEKSIVEMIKIHEVFRIQFILNTKKEEGNEKEGETQLFIKNEYLNENSFILSITNIQQLLYGDSNKNKEMEINDIFSKEYQHPFDLSNEILLRSNTIISYLHNDKIDDTLLLLNMHHIISDEWSNKIILKEIKMFYRIFTNFFSNNIHTYSFENFNIYNNKNKNNQSDKKNYLHKKSKNNITNNTIILIKKDIIDDLSIQYADFSYWQKQWLQGKILYEQVKYWKNKLTINNDNDINEHNNIPYLQIPTDKSRPLIRTFNGSLSKNKILIFTYDQIKLLKGKRKGKEEKEKETTVTTDTTIFMSLLTVFQILLFKYSDKQQEYFTIGSPIANRNLIEIEGLIGFFVNTLVLKCDLSEYGKNLTFNELLLNRVRITCLEAFEYQDIPFDKLVEELNPIRNLDRSPLFQVMFVLQQQQQQQQQQQKQEKEEKEKQQKQQKYTTSKFDLTLFINTITYTNVDLMIIDVDANNNFFNDKNNNQYYIYNTLFEYNTDLFEENTIDKMLEFFNLLLKSITFNNNNNITTMINDKQKQYNNNNKKEEWYIKSLLFLNQKEEKQQLLIEWNDTEYKWFYNSNNNNNNNNNDNNNNVTDNYNYTKTTMKSVHELFEYQSIFKSSDSISIVFEDEQITYKELNNRSNQISNYLSIQFNIGPENLVAISLERSIELIVCILSVLKSGAAYVPIDPNYPEERKNYMLNDSNL